MKLKNVKDFLKKLFEAKDEQKKNAWDKKTILKVLKGALIAATGAFALVALDFLGQVDFTNAQLALFMSWFVPSAINAIKEYKKGK